MKKKKIKIVSFVCFILFLVMPFLQIMVSGVHAQIKGSQPIKVACIGDDLTEGSMTSDHVEKTYPARLGALLGRKYEVRNFGVNGAVTMKGFEASYVDSSQYTESLKYQPDVVVIMLGLNDAKPKFWNCDGNENGEKYKQDLEDIVRSYQKLRSEPKVVLAILPPCNAEAEGEDGIDKRILYQEIIPAQRLMARDYNWEAFDLQNLLEGKEALYKENGIHWNDAGNFYGATHVYEAITGETIIERDVLNIKHKTISKNEIVFALESPSVVNGVQYLPPQEFGHKILTEFEVSVSQDGGKTYRTVGEATWYPNWEWKKMTFTGLKSTHVKIVSNDRDALKDAFGLQILGRARTGKVAFEDVEVTSYYHDAVLWAYNGAILEKNKDMQFRPYETCAKSDVLTILWRAENCPEPETEKDFFSNVNEELFYYKAVQWAAEEEIVEKGYTKEFNAQELCTREDVFTYLMKNSNLKEGKETDDVVQWVIDYKITEGKNAEEMKLDAPCTRGEMIVFLHRYYVGRK